MYHPETKGATRWAKSSVALYKMPLSIKNCQFSKKNLAVIVKVAQPFFFVLFAQKRTKR